LFPPPPEIVSCTNCNPSPSNVLHLGIGSSLEFISLGETAQFVVQDTAGRTFEINFTDINGDTIDSEWFEAIPFTPIVLDYDEGTTAFTAGETVSTATGSATIQSISGGVGSGTLTLINPGLQTGPSHQVI